MNTATQGVLAMIGCCTIWGLSSMFYKLLGTVPPLEILAHRTIWSLVFFALLLGFQGRLKEVRRSFVDWRSGCLTVLAALMILANWYLFIWSVGAERATEASLGYYIYPLVSVLLGWFIYSDRLAKLQWIAIVFAACAVSALTYGLGAAPWVSLMLAGTFAIYGLMKKSTGRRARGLRHIRSDAGCPLCRCISVANMAQRAGRIWPGFHNHCLAHFSGANDGGAADPVQLCCPSRHHVDHRLGRISKPDLAVSMRRCGLF